MFGGVYYGQTFVGDYAPIIVSTESAAPNDNEKYEFGYTQAGSSWVTVFLQNRYLNPVVITDISSDNDSEVAVTVVKNVFSSGFQVRVVEPPSLADDHAEETIAYMVFEAGVGSIDGVGARYEAGIETISDELQGGGSWQDIDAATSLGESIFAQALADGFPSNNQFCKARGQLIGDGQVVLENAQGDTTARTNTKVHWIKFPFFYSPTQKLEVGQYPPLVTVDEFGVTTEPQVTHSWETHTFYNTEYASAPYTIGRLLSREGTDPAEARFQTWTSTTVQMKVEEDIEGDPETDHAAEYVGYIAFEEPLSYQYEPEEIVRGDWGLKISLPGYDVYDATDNQTVFNSAQNIAKIVLEKSAYLKGTDISSDLSSISILHEQPSAPAFLTFVEMADGTWSRGNLIGAGTAFNPFSLTRTWGGYTTNTLFVIAKPTRRSMFILYLERKT